MKTIKSLKDITTLEVGDKIVFGDLEYEVNRGCGYFLNLSNYRNDKIFIDLNISKRDFVEKLGIAILSEAWVFPEVKSLEALTAIILALFKEYENQNGLPKTWEEFCERNPIKSEECIIDIFSNIQKTMGGKRSAKEDRNYCTSKQEAEAFLALMQLRQLRKAYVKDWEPDWSCNSSKFCIIVDVNTIRINDYCFVRKSLSFPTEKLAIQFLTNFKDLLEIAKPLL